MSQTPNPVLVAAAPSLDASLAAISTFLVNLGPDPVKVPATIGPAVQVLLGTLGLQLPAVVTAEWGVVMSGGQSGIADLRKKLAAAIAPAS